MTEPSSAHRSGSLAGEARLLLDAVSAKLTALRGSPAAEDDRDRPATEPGEPSSVTCPECGGRQVCAGCPVCRIMAVVRGDRSDQTARLLDGALAVLTGLRLMVGEPVTGEQPEDVPDPAGPRLERIDIR